MRMMVLNFACMPGCDSLRRKAALESRVYLGWYTGGEERELGGVRFAETSPE